MESEISRSRISFKEFARVIAIIDIGINNPAVFITFPEQDRVRVQWYILKNGEWLSNYTCVEEKEVEATIETFIPEIQKFV